MIRVLMTITIVATPFVRWSAAPLPADREVVYFPLIKNTRWVITQYESEIPEVVMDVVEQDEDKVVTVGRLDASGKPYAAYRMVVSLNGLTQLPADNEKDGVPFRALKLPKTSDPWVGKDDPKNGGFCVLRHLDAETVEVPAGRFKCIRVEMKVKETGLDDIRVVSWYAPNVGCVRIDLDGKPFRVMKSFTPAAK